MATATLQGPFDVWNPTAEPGQQHHYLLTLGWARNLAEVDSMGHGRVQVLDAGHHLIGWARDGVWHGAVA